jgi:hypothetical protein
MKNSLIALLFMVGVVHAATELAPASRIRTVTNNYHILTGNVAQVNFNEIDGWLTNHSGRIDGATNLAQQAYDLANVGSSTNISSLQEAFNHRTYVYTPSNVINVLAGTVGTSQFRVPTQQVGCIHVGMHISNVTIFASNSQVTVVDWTNNLITIDKVLLASVSASTTAVAVATGSASSVTFTHTVPAGYSRCKVTVTGSGATGGADPDASADSGAAGGAGGTSIGFLKLGVGSSVAITVGRKAAITTGGNDGNNGNTSSFGSYCTAYGGSKGSEADSSDGGYGGSAYGGTVNIVGGQGDSWDGSGRVTSGGVSFFGGGIAERRDDAPYGAGGSGWQSYNSVNNYGCAGNGVVIIEYY